MKIGIVELMPEGHYMLVDSLVNIYTSDPLNQVYVFTHETGNQFLQYLRTSMPNVYIITKKSEESNRAFLTQINQNQFDRLYIVTLEQYFKNFYLLACTCTSPIHLFIHNIDEWFLLSFKQRLFQFLSHFSFPRSFFYHFKKNFIYSYWKKKIIPKILASKGKFVVLSGNIKVQLSKYIDDVYIEIIPFSIYKKDLKDSSLNTNFRICIPGKVSAARRNYKAFFDIIEEDLLFFKNKIEIDLLGYLTPLEENKTIMDRIEGLLSKGVKIYFYKKYIDQKEYDENLSKANIILGNINVIVDKYSTYGKTKETGVSFAMIRAAKPGLLPEEYALMNELISSTISYNNYIVLKDFLKDLITNPTKLTDITKKAVINSSFFEPNYLLEKITNN